jgi:membrane associated rhomboid family serine protease
MHEVRSGPSGPAVEVCRVCHFVWFDSANYAQLQAAAPAPVESGAHAGVIAQPRERDFGADAPHELWKYLPALLGLPVVYEQSPLHAIPWLTWTLIAVICVFSIAAFPHIQVAIRELGLVPALWSRDWGLTFLTAFLLHGGLFHLLGNMYFLYIFGDNVEDVLGKARYLALILVAAVIGDIAHIAMDPRSHVPLVGASGGISGVIAFYALKFPKTKMGILFRIGFIPIRWFRVPAYAFVAFWIAVQLIGVVQQMAGASSVSALAHMGGVVTGLVFWLVYRYH